MIPARSVVDLFDDAALRAPDAPAIRCGAELLTYGQLQAQADRFAGALRASGVRPGSCVGLCFERSAVMIAAMLGALKSGAAYVPLLPDQPRSRLAAEIERAAVGVVVADAASAGAIPSTVLTLRASGDAEDGVGAASPAVSERGDLAYVLFTSGSTGTPKGVAVTHANLLHYTRAITLRLGVAADERLHFGLVSTLGADLGYTAIFPALCSGGMLHVIANDVATDASRFAAYLESHPVDVLKITPSHLGALLREGGEASVLPRRWLVLGGEALSWQLAARIGAAGGCRILNHYGPTETTVGACTYVVDEDGLRDASATVPIGRPLSDTLCYVVDGAGGLAADGEAGELYIGGAGVARGYVGEAALTAERFVDDRFAGRPGGRLYATGDRVRRLSGGALEFLGRLDDQVKVRGFRVELGEIESVLRQHPALAQTAVICDAQADSARLVAYVVPHARTAGGAPSTELRAWLAERLPDYMVPSAFVTLERLPLTANGKLDRASLPDANASFDERALVEPRTPTEAQVCAIWAEVFGHRRIGATDAFLELGGHSILAIRLLGKVKLAFGVRLTLKALFEASTPRGLATLVDAEASANQTRELERMLASVDGLSDEEIEQLESRAQLGAP